MGDRFLSPLSYGRKPMNYGEALQYIHGTLKFGSKLGLDNIRTLLHYMDNPHQKLQYIHVAGTNGKGSTSAMMASILREQGYRAGLFISPYIEEFTERIQINREKISKQDLARITANVKATIEKMIADGCNHPTEFEIVTAIAFRYFYEQQCDIVVLEVGLGGRFDATNVIESSLVSVITSISMDHTEYLGDTIDKIAYEKSGIIKPNSTVVVYPDQHPDALEVIKQTAREQHAQLIISNNSNYTVVSDTIEGIRFHYKDYKDIEIPLLGLHQVKNAMTAITAIEALSEYSNMSISSDSIKIGLKKVTWPGRLEVLGVQPLFIIDGAHNIAGINALKTALEKYRDARKIVFIIGMLRDKAYETCVSEIASMADLIITTTPQNPRALPAKELGSIVKQYSKNVRIENNIQKVIQMAVEHATTNDLICCFGSLYLIGEIKNFFGEIY